VAAGIGWKGVPLSSRGVGSVSVPSTMSKSLWNFNVALVDISQTLYDSGLNSRRVIFLVVLSSAIVCLFVCLFVCVLLSCCSCIVTDDAERGIYLKFDETGSAEFAPVFPLTAKPTVFNLR